MKQLGGIDHEMAKRDITRLGLFQLSAVLLGRVALGVATAMARLTDGVGFYQLGTLRGVQVLKSWWLVLALVPLLWVALASWLRLRALRQGAEDLLPWITISGWALFATLAGTMGIVSIRAMGLVPF